MEVAVPAGVHTYGKRQASAQTYAGCMGSSRCLLWVLLRAQAGRWGRPSPFWNRRRLSASLRLPWSQYSCTSRTSQLCVCTPPCASVISSRVVSLIVMLRGLRSAGQGSTTGTINHPPTTAHAHASGAGLHTVALLRSAQRQRPAAAAHPSLDGHTAKQSRGGCKPAACQQQQRQLPFPRAAHFSRHPHARFTPKTTSTHPLSSGVLPLMVSTLYVYVWTMFCRGVRGAWGGRGRRQRLGEWQHSTKHVSRQWPGVRKTSTW